MAMCEGVGIKCALGPLAGERLLPMTWTDGFGSFLPFRAGVATVREPAYGHRLM